MASNPTNQNISGVLAIIGLIGMIAILILEFCYDIEVNNWFFYLAFSLLFVDGMLFFRYRKANNEDKKYKDKGKD